MVNDVSMPKSSKAIPTNTVIYKGRKIPARIDPAARIGHVVEVMARSFETSEHHITLCLRDQSDHLITQSKLAAKVANKDTLKLAPSPSTEALAVISSLKTHLSLPSHQRFPSGGNQSSMSLSTDAQTGGGLPLKLALFNIQKYVREEDFTIDLLLKGGMRMLVKLLEREGLTGNSLAYALQGVRGILEYEAGWSDITVAVVDRIIAILASSAQTNVLKPATSIIRKLILSSPHLRRPADPYKPPSARSKGKEREIEISVDVFGFDAIWRRMGIVGLGMESAEKIGDGQGAVMAVVVKRLEGGGDLELVSLSLGLINASLRTGDEDGSLAYNHLVITLEQLNIRKYVSRLMPTCSSNVVEAQILNFQSRWTAILQRRRITLVRPKEREEHAQILTDIYALGKLEMSGRLNGISEDIIPEAAGRTMGGWRRLGWDHDVEDGEDEEILFRDVGELGLECLHFFASHNEHFSNLILEQEAKLEDRRCPIGRASNECVKILCEHYKVSQAGHVHPTHFQPFLLHFTRLHHLALSFFIRMWQESGSCSHDFYRLTNLVRSQLGYSISKEEQATWLSLEQDLLESDYQVIRERQMEALEREDGVMANDGVRELRETISRGAYEVIADQRIGCMLQGAWFNAATLIVPGIQATVRPNAVKPLRFVRLSPNRKVVAWGDFNARPKDNPEYEALRERIELSNVTSISPNTSTAVNSRSQNLASKLSFSLLSGPDMSLLDLDAIHSAQLAEWLDGLREVKGEGGMRCAESTGYVKILAEIALKVRLLDITGDGVELPGKVIYGTAPLSSDFWFAK